MALIVTALSLAVQSTNAQFGVSLIALTLLILAAGEQKICIKVRKAKLVTHLSA